MKYILVGVALMGLLSLGAEVSAQATDVDCGGCVDTSDLAGKSVTNSKIGADSVSTGKISNGAVTSEKIASGAITKSKIADNAVKGSHIKAKAVSVSKIAPLAVNENKIAPGAVTGSKISGSISIAATAFNPIDPATTVGNYATNGKIQVLSPVTNNTNGKLQAPLLLPAGTAIKQIYFRFWDQSVTESVTVRLQRVVCAPNCEAGVEIAAAGSTAGFNGGFGLASSGVLNEVVLPGPDYFYRLELDFSAFASLFAYSVTVEYGAP